MKKAGLLKLLSAVTLAAAGLFGSVALKESSKAESVNADTVAANKRVYLNTSSFSSWNDSNATFKMWFKMNGSDVANANGTKVTIKGSSDIIYVFTSTAQYNSIYVERCSSAGAHWNGFDITASSSKDVIKVNGWDSGSFDDATYNIYYETVTASSGGSAVMYVKGNSGQSGNGYYYNHSGLTLAASANSGYHFVRWQRNGTQVSTNATYTIDSIGGDYTWNAVFEKDAASTHSVTYNSGGATSGTVPTQSNVEEGKTFTVASYGDLMKNGKEFTGWSDGSTIYQPGSTYTMGQSNVTLTAQWTDMVTGKVYFTNNFKWDNVSQFSVVTEGVAGSRNYGVTKAYTNENSEDIYYATIPIHNSFRFTNSYDSTVFISGWVENRAYYLLNTQTEGRYNVGTWTVKPYTISYQGNGSTSGSMSAETAYANVAWGLTSNAFAKTGHVFDSWNTRADGTGTKYANSALLPQDVVASGATITLYAQWRVSYTSGRYIVNGDLNMANARLMTYTNNQYVATVTLAYKENFKSGWYDDGTGLIDNYYGYSRLYSGCGAYHYFSVDEADNIVCYARGTYIIYVNDNNISIELQNPNVLTSEHLAAQLMSFGSTPSTGHCGDNDRFPAMKSIYLNKLNATEKSTFQSYVSSSEAQFKNAYDRYVAWARALGENPWAEGKANNAALLLGASAKTTSNVVIIVVVSLVSLSSIGGYFYLRRRKAQ